MTVLSLSPKIFLNRPPLGPRRVGYRDSRRPIRLFERIETRTVVCRTTQIEHDRRLRAIPDALVHVLDVLRELSSQAEGRRCLQTVGLPRRRKERPAQSVGQREVRLDAPGILPVKLVPVEPIISLDRCTLRQRRCRCGPGCSWQRRPRSCRTRPAEDGRTASRSQAPAH